MALKQISLQKIVISNKDSNDRYKKNFDQLAKSSEEFNVEVIKNIYISSLELIDIKMKRNFLKYLSK